jgi:hypothetical protein
MGRRPATGAGGCGEIRYALGVYLLGAIGPADRSAVSSHLVGCADCREVLARLAGLPGLLGSVSADDAARLATEEADRAGGDEVPPGVTLPSLLAQVARLRRRRLCRRLAVTAAVVVIAAGGSAAGSRVLYPPVERPAAAVLPWATTIQASNPRTGAVAAVRYAPQPWGLALDVQVSGIPAGTTCELRVISSQGQDRAAGGWTIAGGHPGAWYPASSPFPVADVRGFAITTGGRTLVSVPIR